MKNSLCGASAWATARIASRTGAGSARPGSGTGMERMIPIGGNSFFTSSWIRISPAQSSSRLALSPGARGMSSQKWTKSGW